MFRDDGQTFGARPKVSSNSYANGANQNCGNVLSDTPTTRVAAPPGGRSSISLGWDTSSASDARPAGYRPAVASPVKPQQYYDKDPGYRGGSPAQPQQYYDEDPASSPYKAGFPSPQRGPAPARPPPNEAIHGARPRESSNQYACGSNQNQGNFLTDTPTTRVLRPPGGSSTSNMLSWDEEPRQARPQARPQMSQRVDQRWDDDPRQAQPQAGQRAGQRWDDDPRQAQHQAGQRGGQRWDDDPPQARQQISQRAGQRGEVAPVSPGDVVFGQRSRVSSNSFANGADQNCGNVLSDTPTTRVLKPPGGHSNFRLG